MTNPFFRVLSRFLLITYIDKHEETLLAVSLFKYQYIRVCVGGQLSFPQCRMLIV